MKPKAVMKISKRTQKRLKALHEQMQAEKTLAPFKEEEPIEAPVKVEESVVVEEVIVKPKVKKPAPDFAGDFLKFIEGLRR